MVDNFLEDVCNGFTLSLKVYGVLLYGGDWEDEIGSLQHTLPNEIKKTFMRSYN